MSDMPVYVPNYSADHRCRWMGMIEYTGENGAPYTPMDGLWVRLEDHKAKLAAAEKELSWFKARDTAMQATMDHCEDCFVAMREERDELRAALERIGHTCHYRPHQVCAGCQASAALAPKTKGTG